MDMLLIKHTFWGFIGDIKSYFLGINMGYSYSKAYFLGINMGYSYNKAYFLGINIGIFL